MATTATPWRWVLGGIIPGAVAADAVARYLDNGQLLAPLRSGSCDGRPAAVQDLRRSPGRCVRVVVALADGSTAYGHVHGVPSNGNTSPQYLGRKIAALAEQAFGVACPECGGAEVTLSRPPGWAPAWHCHCGHTWRAAPAVEPNEGVAMPGQA